MIKVITKETNNIINEVEVRGHAMYNEAGKDIVCASVSSIVTTTINAIVNIDENAITYEDNDGYIKINNIKKDEFTNKLLLNMINMLSELEDSYPKNINMKRGI